MKIVEIYTDGSHKPHQKDKPGTWAYVVVDGKKSIHTDCGKEWNTTNNRMELMGVLEGLKWAIKNVPDNRIYFRIDSQYVQLGLTEWIDGWVKKGWKTSKKEPVLNQDLWKELLKLKEVLTVQFTWVRGHHADPDNWNNVADRLCETAYGIPKQETVEELPIGGSIRLEPTLEQRLMQLEYQVEQLQERVALMDKNIAIQIDALQTDVKWLNQNITIA